MKRIIALFAFAAVTVLAQPSSPSFTTSQGTAAVTTKPCTSSQNVGSIYTRIANPSVTYVCSQIGASSLGSGAFGWVSVPKSGSGTGSVNVAAGKTLTVSNSLTLAGTDATTATFPATSITVSGATAQACGTTSTCAATNVGATVKIVTGSAPLVSGTPSTVAITGISPAFTSAATYSCTVTNATTAANVLSVLTAGYVSGSAFTITGPNTLTDVARYVCVGY